jgi:hypothetical protein
VLDAAVAKVDPAIGAGEEIQHHGSGGAVEVSGRLVGQEKGRLDRESARESDALLFTP